MSSIIFYFLFTIRQAVDGFAQCTNTTTTSARSALKASNACANLINCWSLMFFYDKANLSNFLKITMGYGFAHYDTPQHQTTSARSEGIEYACANLINCLSLIFFHDKANPSNFLF